MSKERTVVLSGPETAAQAQAIYGGQGGTRLSDLVASIPEFTRVSYDCFLAEYHVSDENIVVHFFVPQRRRVTAVYWKEMFAEALNSVGEDHFLATSPRLVARYTEELQSWWFKAQGYGHIIDPVAYVTAFFVKLDARLFPLLETQSRTV